MVNCALFEVPIESVSMRQFFSKPLSFRVIFYTVIENPHPYSLCQCPLELGFLRDLEPGHRSFSKFVLILFMPQVLD